MIFLRQKYKVKPRQYGPPSQVQASLFQNAERIGIDPAFYRLALPFWGPGFQKDYINEKGFNLNARAIWDRNRLNLIKTKIDTGIPSFQSDSMTIIMDLNADRDRYDGGILDTKGGSAQWDEPKGFSINLRGYLPGTDGGLLFAVGSNKTVINNGPLFDLKKMHNLACVFKASVKRQVFFNGKEPSYDRQDANLSGFTLGSNYVIGSYYDYASAVRSFKGRIGNIVIFSTDISPDTVSEFNDNPYQLWQRVPPVFYSLPGGDIVFLINNVNQGQSVSTFTLDQFHNISTASITQAQAVETLALNQLHMLITADINQGQSVDQQTLSQLHYILTSDVSQAQAINSPALSQLHALITDNVAQGQFVQALNLTQLHTLLTNSVAHGQSVDEPVIQLLTQLVIDNVSQGQIVNPLTLTQLINLTIENVSQSQTVDSVTVQQIHDLIINAITQSQSVDVLELVIPGALVIHSIIQGQAVQAPTLAQKIALTLDNISQSQSVAPLTLIQLHALVCDNINQDQSVDTSSLEQLISLSIQNISQGQTVESPSFFQVFQLNIDDVNQSHTASTMSLSQLSQLIIDDIDQGQIIESIRFSLPRGKVTVTITARIPGVQFDARTPGVNITVK